MACNGLLGGLVAITAPCAFVTPAAALMIGIIAGLLVVAAVLILERHFRIDDPVGAIAVHGACGMWGALALGIFADGSYGDGWNAVAGPVRGLLYGDPGQFVAQLIGVTVNIVVVFGLALMFFMIVERTIGNRVIAGSGMDRARRARNGQRRLHQLVAAPLRSYIRSATILPSHSNRLMEFVMILERRKFLSGSARPR